MTDWIVLQAINHYVPKEYMPIILIVLSFFLALEQWLASTNRIKANSTLQMIVNFVQYFIAKEKGDGTLNLNGQSKGSGTGGNPGADSGSSQGSGAGSIDGSRTGNSGS
jgi:hypothetical protein